MNYTDEQIIKALEEMSIFKVVKLGSKNVLRPAADLIKRLKAENERLEENLKSQKVINTNLGLSYTQAKVEVEQWKEEANRYQNLYCEASAENEELRKENIIATQKRANIFEIVNAYERGRTEARKEFAENSVERVEKAKLKYQRLCKEQGEEMEEHISILFDGIIGIINNLLEEMEKEK